MLGDKIKALRKQKGATQTEFAEYLSVSPQTVSKWEHHISAPDLSLLPSIARYFKISIDELFSYQRESLDFKDKFIRFMYDNKMLRFGSFALKSGRVSPYHIDSGYYHTNNQISSLGDFYAEALREHALTSSCLVGLSVCEIAIVISVGMTLYQKYSIDIQYCIDIEHLDLIGVSSKITLLVDTFTSGETLIQYIMQFQNKCGRYPNAILVGVDRMEHSNQHFMSAKCELEARFDLKIYSIVTLDDIVNAVKKDVIPANEYKQSIMEYQKKYKGV